MKKFKIIPILMMIMTFSSSIVFAKVDTEELRVLVIEQNPMLLSVGKTAAEQLGQDDEIDLVVDEMIEDIEYSSHGNVDVEIVGWELFDEFVTSKIPMELVNGQRAYTLDEETWFDYMKNGWRTYWVNKDVIELGQYQYDYDHLIDSFDLIERKNNDEFDQVWLVGVDPLNPYETVMVGDSAYWVNGPAIEKDCENFVIMTLYVSRRDANFECFGHMAENVMRKVFGRSYDSYEPDTMIINDKDNLESLNLWERFCLTTYSTGGTYASVGNIHFSPNSEADYDWLNEDYVESDWIDWAQNYPNLTGETILTNYEAWCPTGNKNTVCRDHHRWWFSLFPHVEGYTEDGYSNNWWDYLVTLDFVVDIEPVDDVIELEQDEKISNIAFNVTYNSGKIEKIRIKNLDENVVISNEKIASFKNGKLVGKKEGTTYLEIMLDGESAKVKIKVYEAEDEEEYEDEENYDDYYDDEVINNQDNTWSNASEWAITELTTAKEKSLIPKILDERDFTEKITREEFASAMVSLYESLNGLTAEVPSYNPFIDTNNKEVLKAYKLGITNGTSTNTFSPDDNITRQEIATMLMRLIEASGVYISENDFMIHIIYNDNEDIADWASRSIVYMSNRGIIKGFPSNLFAPLENASIEEAMALSVRILCEFKY